LPHTGSQIEFLCKCRGIFALGGEITGQFVVQMAGEQLQTFHT